jgi:hypothetical protein
MSFNSEPQKDKKKPLGCVCLGALFFDGFLCSNFLGLLNGIGSLSILILTEGA